MNKSICILSIAVLFMAKNALASDQVWRYVDEKSGQVSYSNVPVKGKKGDKVEIMAHPVSASRAVGSAVGSPIPADVLRQLQGSEGRPVKPPSGLPPLPSLPGSKFVPAEAPVAFPESASEPKWAKEVPVTPGATPSWAKDPFSQKIQ